MFVFPIGFGVFLFGSISGARVVFTQDVTWYQYETNALGSVPAGAFCEVCGEIRQSWPTKSEAEVAAMYKSATWNNAEEDMLATKGAHTF